MFCCCWNHWLFVQRNVWHLIFCSRSHKADPVKRKRPNEHNFALHWARQPASKHFTKTKCLGKTNLKPFIYPILSKKEVRVDTREIWHVILRKLAKKKYDKNKQIFLVKIACWATERIGSQTSKQIHIGGPGIYRSLH